MHHGRHIKVIGSAEPEAMRSVANVERFLRDLIGKLGMRALGAPLTFEVEEELARIGAEPFEDEGGTTGIAVLSTSHCAIHTWPLRSYFVMDVYSCRDFDPALVEATLVDHFGAHRMKVTDLSHALQPPAVDAALAEDARSEGRSVETATN